MFSCLPQTTLSLLRGDNTTSGVRNWSPLIIVQPWLSITKSNEQEWLLELL